MVKNFLSVILFLLPAIHCYAENIKICEGRISKIDEYSNGLMVIWHSGEQCGEQQRFWITDDYSKDRVKIIVEASVGTNQPVVAMVDTELTLDKFDGKLQKLKLKK